MEMLYAHINTSEYQSTCSKKFKNKCIQNFFVIIILVTTYLFAMYSHVPLIGKYNPRSKYVYVNKFSLETDITLQKYTTIIWNGHLYLFKTNWRSATDCLDAVINLAAKIINLGESTLS